jgi:hypothetical protein
VTRARMEGPSAPAADYRVEVTRFLGALFFGAVFFGAFAFTGAFLAVFALGLVGTLAEAPSAICRAASFTLSANAFAGGSSSTVVTSTIVGIIPLHTPNFACFLNAAMLTRGFPS